MRLPALLNGVDAVSVNEQFRGRIYIHTNFQLFDSLGQFELNIKNHAFTRAFQNFFLPKSGMDSFSRMVTDIHKHLFADRCHMAAHSESVSARS